MWEFNGFKNIFMCIHKKKLHTRKSINHYCYANRGVKALVECPAKNASFFYVLPKNLTKKLSMEKKRIIEELSLLKTLAPDPN